jgi:hypothetical protein
MFSKSIEEFYKALFMEGRLTPETLYIGVGPLTLNEALLMKSLLANLNPKNKNLDLMSSTNTEEYFQIMRLRKMVTLKGHIIKDSISCSELLYLKFLIEKDKNYTVKQKIFICNFLNNEVSKKKLKGE